MSLPIIDACHGVMAGQTTAQVYKAEAAMQLVWCGESSREVDQETLCHEVFSG